MQRFQLFYTQSWYTSLPEREKELVRTSLELYSREERMNSTFVDYSYIVFPMAKAYEGFLKRLFFDLQLISREIYQDKHFRIGRALNPDLHPSRKDEAWLFDDLSRMCGADIARRLWDTWLQCRNQVFHFFPENQKKLSLSEAGKDLEVIAHAMDLTLNCMVR